MIFTPFVILLFGALLFQAVLYYWNEDYGTLTAVLSHIDGEAITFGEEDGLFEGSLDVTLQMHKELPDDARIFYTLDGTDPDGTSERYFAPVHLGAPGSGGAGGSAGDGAGNGGDAGEDAGAGSNAGDGSNANTAVTMVTLKACVVWRGECSPVQTHTYILARDSAAYEAVKDLYVAGITIPEAALYDYSTGLLVEGLQHDLAVRRGEEKPDSIGNWSQEGPDWVRAAHLDLFSPVQEAAEERAGDGSLRALYTIRAENRPLRAENSLRARLLASQAVGISLSGGVTRHNSPPSLMLTAGNIFEEAYAQGNAGVIKGLAEAFDEDSDAAAQGEAASDGSAAAAAADTTAGNTAATVKDPSRPDDPGVNDRFALDIFMEKEASPLSYITQYRKIRLRAMNQPLRNVQTPFLFRLANEAGLDGVAQNARALVVVNGEVFSIADLQPSYTDGWLARRFSLPDSTKIEKVKGSEYRVFETFGVLDLFRADLNDEDARAALEERVDIDDLLLYYAIEMLADNRDWPQNNFEAWRYTGGGVTGTEDSEDSATVGISPEDNVYADGRLRFLLYDVDYVYMGSHQGNYFGTDAFLNALHGIGSGNASIFADLMKVKEYRHRFVQIACDLLETTFATDHVLAVYDEEYDGYLAQVQALDLRNEEQLAAMEEVSAERRQAIKSREKEFRDLLETYLVNWRNGRSLLEMLAHPNAKIVDAMSRIAHVSGDPYPYTLSTSGGVSLHWGARSMAGDEQASGTYFEGITSRATASPYPGWEFAGWFYRVDGNAAAGSGAPADGFVPVSADTSSLSDDGLTIDMDALRAELAEDGLYKSSQVLEVCAAGRQLDGELVIAEASSKDGKDWLRLTNAGSTPVDLLGYQILNERAGVSNNLPDVTLDSGESLLLCSRKSMIAHVGDVLVNFSLREGDKLVLSKVPAQNAEAGLADVVALSSEVMSGAEAGDEAGGNAGDAGDADSGPSLVVDSLTIPRMCDGETYGHAVDAAGRLTDGFLFYVE